MCSDQCPIPVLAAASTSSPALTLARHARRAAVAAESFGLALRLVGLGVVLGLGVGVVAVGVATSGLAGGEAVEAPGIDNPPSSACWLIPRKSRSPANNISNGITISNHARRPRPFARRACVMLFPRPFWPSPDGPRASL